MNLNLGSVAVKRSPKYMHARFSFRCGCRAFVDLLTENLSKLHFCRKVDCPSSAFAQEVWDEHVSVERRRTLLKEFELEQGAPKLFVPGEGHSGSAVKTLAALTALMRRP